MSVIMAAVCLAASILTQSDQPQPDRWHGMVINESTPEDAIKALGQPASNKVDRLRIFDIDQKWISPKHKEKTFQRLEFKQIANVDGATLSFADNKLVMIELDLKEKIDSSALSRIYSLDFLPRISGFQQAVNPRDYERHEGRVYPKTYPSVYSIIAVTDKVFIGAMVGNVGFGVALRGSAGIPDAGAMPGKIERIQIVSRKLENRDGADALK